MFRVVLSTFLLLALLVGTASAEQGLVHFGFEEGDLEGWKVVAGEFSQPVCQYGAHGGGNLPKSGEEAHYLTTSGAAMGQTGPDTERMGGVIESPVFVIQGDEATFLLGGVAAKCTLHTADGRQLRAASGWARGNLKTVRWDVSKFRGQPVFAEANDDDYQTLFRLVRESKAIHESDPRFDMPGFRPSGHYVRNMQDYGVLPRRLDAGQARIDPYATDRAYWRSFWYRPQRGPIESDVR